jgi:hypothetical protein
MPLKGERMRRLISVLCIGWIAACGGRPYSFERLAFGMTKDEVAAVLGAPLSYLSGRPGAEVFIVQQSANIPWYFPSQERLYLQFRRGRLTGWKGDWRIQRSWF